MSPELSQPSFQGPQEGGQPPGGGFPSQPGQANPDAMANLDLVKGVVTNLRLLAQKIPGAVDIVRQMNELAQKLQMKIIQSGSSPEPQAPPV